MMKSSSRTRNSKTPRHAIGGLLALSTPGSGLSKSFSNQTDLRMSDQVKPSQRNLARHRRSIGSAEYNRNEIHSAFETEEDTETPRQRIEDFLSNVETAPTVTVERSLRRTPGRKNARSFTRTPNKEAKSLPVSSKVGKSTSFSYQSQSHLYTPKTNLEHLLHGPESELTPYTRARQSRQTMSDAKSETINKSRNWGQRVSVTPLYHSSIGDELDSNTTRGGNFRSLRPRRSFHILETAGNMTEPTSFPPVTPRSSKRPTNPRLSKSDSKIKSGPRSSNWAQRVSVSPMPYSGLRDDEADNSASPRHIFKHVRKRKSFHIPQPPLFHATEKDSHGKDDPMPTLTDANEMENDGLGRNTLRNEPSQNTTLSPLPSSELVKDNLDADMQKRMKIYDLSDASSDSDFSFSQIRASRANQIPKIRPHTLSPRVVSPHRQSLPTSPMKSSSDRRQSSISDRVTRSVPRAFKVNDEIHSLNKPSRKRNFRGDGVDGNSNVSTAQQKEASQSFQAVVPLAPPSSTPLKRHKSSVRSNVVDNTMHSKSKDHETEVISDLANDTLSGLSPIRAADDDRILDDVPENNAIDDEVVKAAMMSEEDDEEVDDDEEDEVDDGGKTMNTTLRTGAVAEDEVLAHAHEDAQTPSGSKEIQDADITRNNRNNRTVEQQDMEPGNEFPSHESSSASVDMKTPHIDMTKKPPPLSGRKLNLLTPLNEAKNKSRNVKKVMARQQSNKSGKAAVKTPFVSRGMIKFYAEKFANMRLNKEALEELEKVSEEFWSENLRAAEGYAKHAGRKTISEADVVLLMKVQRMIKSTEHLHDLIREHLPMHLRCELIPTAQPHFAK